MGCGSRLSSLCQFFSRLECNSREGWVGLIAVRLAMAANPQQALAVHPQSCDYGGTKTSLWNFQRAVKTQ